MRQTGMDPGIEHAASSEAWLRHTLEEILVQLRVLLDIDGCAFQTVDWDRREIHLAAAWFETPAIRATLRPVLERPYDPERGGVTEAAIERGRPLLLGSVAQWSGAEALRERLREHLDEATADAAWSWYETSTFIACPVRTTGGRTLGVLALSSSAPRAPLGDEQLRVTEVFANLAALALERSELLVREARRARAEELLHTAAQAMTASLELDSVYAAIVEQAAIVTGAPTVMLLRLDNASQTLRVVASAGASERLTSHHFARGAGMIGAAFESGRPYVSDPADREAMLGWVFDEGVGSFVHVPLGLGPRRFGMLTVIHPDEGALDGEVLALLDSFARPAAAAIANALEFQHERRIAGALTRGFVPGAPPELEGFELGLVYEPVGHEVSGGDIFGVWRLPSGALAVLVGDVSGKGLEVAAASSMVRFFIEARTWDSEDPAVVLAQANAILRRRLPGRVSLVTAFLAVIDHGVLRYANAGHVPPLLLGRAGEPRELPTTGLPLGVADGATFEQHELPFGRDELLFASTDGLHEARRDGELLGQERVSALVAGNRALDAQALVELAYAEAEAWARELSDDVAIIALRPRPPGRGELREEAPDGAAAQALYAQYMELLRDRLGAGFSPTERIFGRVDAFTAEGGAWLVAYDEDGVPVGCGGLRQLAAGVGEIKRMFVAPEARGAGHGRRLLRALELRAAAHGQRRVRVLTTDVLTEAIALYAAEGYRTIQRSARDGRPVEIWMEKELDGPDAGPAP
ncbi:MAG TPA: GNAT family N-acetyltransferase [Solirubrobacteraceae bacterium]|nr:GNAT family N-acetyltransferase [Solirubrobacteraceae bacterium]